MKTSAGGKPSILIRPSGYIVLSLLSIVTVGLFFVSYSAGIGLLVGGVLSLPVSILLRAILVRMSKFSWRDFLSSPKTVISLLWRVIIQVIIVIIIVSVLIDTLVVGQLPFMSLFLRPCAVIAYQVIVEPISPALETFTIKENVVLKSYITDDSKFSPDSTWSIVNTDDGSAFRLPTRQVNGTSKGLVLKEVTVEPFPNIFDLSLACAKTSVELRDFPKNSFYAAKEATNLGVSPYIDTETITWVAHNLDERKIEFAYVPPPYYYLRPILSPFVGISSLSQWIVGFIGVIGAVILIPIVKPVLTAVAQSKLKSWFDRTPNKKPVNKATLIISSDGTEKEIETKEKGK